MTINQSDLKALLQKSGNRCAFPDCGELLLADGHGQDETVVLSNIAHIVGRKSDGPRGKHYLPLDKRDDESNLMLLCRKHHAIVDERPAYYSVERLRQMKADHESLIQTATGQATARLPGLNPSYVRETVYSTLLPVVAFPQYIYGAPCVFTDHQKQEVRAKIARPSSHEEMYPYVIRGNMLYAFQRLDDADGPFQDIVDRGAVEKFQPREWWDDLDKSNWLITLLNRALNKLTGRKGLNWDKDHYRYYFAPEEPGKIREVTYRPLNQSIATRQVVWQPINKKTKEPRPFWFHRAVSLRFQRVGPAHWCLSLRPEFRVTKDGITSLDSDKIGSQVTRKKSRMFNYDLLAEINFWRDFLSESRPRIIFNFGRSQPIIVSTKMMEAEVNWPGIPDKYAKPFKNVEYHDDLFSYGEYLRAQTGLDEVDEDEEEEWSADDDEEGDDAQ